MQRLILGCGKHHLRQDGDVTLDVRPFPGVNVVHDLNVTPWPLEDSRFVHVSAIHVVEHLRDLVSFMDECWRVTAPGGDMYIESPLAGADPDLEFCDPTHVRCYRPYTFANYFTPRGIEDFGYTDKPWCIYKVGPHPAAPAVLVFHGAPIKS